MIRKATILLCLCCAVLCAFVGYMSYNVTQESEKTDVDAVSATCENVLDSPLAETSRIRLTEFASGKHLASVDANGDELWDSVCVPFFPRKRQKIGHAYRAVLVCFKNVPTRDELDLLIADGELEVNFWPERQDLQLAIHSQLAQKYTNMDFAQSPVMYFGYESGNPLLGETSLLASVAVGSVALFVAFLAMIAGFVTRKKPEAIDVEVEDQPTTNRAGLPVGESVSILDQVTSMRSSSEN